MNNEEWLGRVFSIYYFLFAYQKGCCVGNGGSLGGLLTVLASCNKSAGYDNVQQGGAGIVRDSAAGSPEVLKCDPKLQECAFQIEM